MKRIIVAFIIGLSIQAAISKELPPLYSLIPMSDTNQTILVRAKDFNVLVEHIQELERQVHGMQKQITLLHSIKEDKQCH